MFVAKLIIIYNSSTVKSRVTFTSHVLCVCTYNLIIIVCHLYVDRIIRDLLSMQPAGRVTGMLAQALPLSLI